MKEQEATEINYFEPMHIIDCKTQKIGERKTGYELMQLGTADIFCIRIQDEESAEMELLSAPREQVLAFFEELAQSLTEPSQLVYLVCDWKNQPMNP